MHVCVCVMFAPLFCSTGGGGEGGDFTCLFILASLLAFCVLCYHPDADNIQLVSAFGILHHPFTSSLFQHLVFCKSIIIHSPHPACCQAKGQEPAGCLATDLPLLLLWHCWEPAASTLVPCEYSSHPSSQPPLETNKYMNENVFKVSPNCFCPKWCHYYTCIFSYNCWAVDSFVAFISAVCCIYFFSLLC